MELPDALKRLLAGSAAARLLTTVDHLGASCVVARESMTVLDDETLAFAEARDDSQTSRDLVGAFESGGRVGVEIGSGVASFVVRATPWRCLYGGGLFKSFQRAAWARTGNVPEQSAVWLLRVEDVRAAGGVPRSSAVSGLPEPLLVGPPAAVARDHAAAQRNAEHARERREASGEAGPTRLAAAGDPVGRARLAWGTATIHVGPSRRPIAVAEAVRPWRSPATMRDRVGKAP